MLWISQIGGSARLALGLRKGGTIADLRGYFYPFRGNKGKKIERIGNVKQGEGEAGRNPASLKLNALLGGVCCCLLWFFVQQRQKRPLRQYAR